MDFSICKSKRYSENFKIEYHNDGEIRLFLCPFGYFILNDLNDVSNIKNDLTIHPYNHFESHHYHSYFNMIYPLNESGREKLMKFLKDNRRKFIGILTTLAYN